MQWKRMTQDEYALYQQASGIRTVQTDSVWWAEVKPCFYRPLLPWTVLKPAEIHYPVKSYIGGIQHAIPQGMKSNSYINLFFLDDLQSYSLEGMCHKRRNKIKKGLNYFTAKQITDCHEFKDQAYKVYLSFYDRTKYGYKKDRLHKNCFNAWSDTLFANPNLLILGAYYEDKLCAVNTSYQVDDIVIGASFFADTHSLSMGISDYLLHTIREIAVKSDATRIFYGWATGERGLDEFKISRGCTLDKIPAWFHINPGVHLLTKCFKKYQMNKLLGVL